MTGSGWFSLVDSFNWHPWIICMDEGRRANVVDGLELCELPAWEVLAGHFVDWRPMNDEWMDGVSE